MKQGAPAFFTSAFFLVAGTLGALLCVGLVLVFDWPWWVGLFLLLLEAGLTLGVLSLRKVWLRVRERDHADEIAVPEGARAKGLSPRGKSEPDGLLELQKRCKSAIDTLRNSQLNKSGNPLYVLPWYLMIGASGSGKSCSLAGARLASPLRESSRGQGVSGTKQCDWWLSDQAVLIDCAGRYAIPVDEKQDREEWRKLLSLLIKYRRREPLNGVLVAVTADQLLEADQEQLANYGSTVRQRIDELMRALGVRVPVYALVTKCDLVPGVEQFCERLPAQSLDQSLGMLNQELSADVGAFVERALRVIDERLRKLRLQLLHRPKPEGADPELLLFPEEFQKLKQGLLSFMTHAFGENPYQETPLLRGMFFSSGDRQGNPPCHIPCSKGRAGTGEGRSGSGEGRRGTGKGLFLHDLFTKILPGDRFLLTPTRRSREWRAVTGNLGLTSWVMLGVALCGLLSFSFVKNLHAIRDASEGFSKAVSLHGDLAADLAAMERYRRDIAKVEGRNRHWWLPRLGLTESVKVEKGLKARFCRQFREEILIPFDQRMAAGMTTVSPATPDGSYAQYVMHLVRRINILKASLAGQELGKLQAQPQPAYVSWLGSRAAAGTGETGKTFGALHLYATIWREDARDFGKEMALLQSRLKELMAVKGGNLQWLAVWVNGQSGLSGVTLQELWGGSLTAAGENSVAPVFTRRGKEALDSLVRELEAAVPDPAPVAAQKASLALWYRGAAFEAWRAFAAEFPRGEARLSGPIEWQQAASRMASEQGAYFALFSKLVLELEPLVREAPAPPWLQQVYQFQSLRAQGLARESAAIGKAAQGGQKMLGSFRKNVGQDAGAHKLQLQLETAKACQDYCSALTAITPAVASRNRAFQLASQAFGDDPATSGCPLHAAASASARLKAGISGMSGAAADPVFSQLLNGPLEFLWSYLRRESATQLQALWEEQVLAAIMGMPGQQAIPALLGPDGLAWRFVKGPAAPFLTRSLSGYRAKEALGGEIPFDAALFSFMKKGDRAQAAVMAMGRPQHYRVGIKGLPTDANVEARVKPHATRLEMQCGTNSQSLINNNYPVGRSFSWAPDLCGDVLLQIEVGDLLLTRHYPGQQGFPDFLKDLRGGRRVFAAREFPDEKSALEGMGVQTITVNYKLIGSEAILRQAATLSGQAPRSIARSWSH